MTAGRERPQLKVFDPQPITTEETATPGNPLEWRVRAIIDQLRVRMLSPDEATRRIVELLKEDRET